MADDKATAKTRVRADDPRKMPDAFCVPGAVIPTPIGQVYRLDRVEPHERRDGVMTSLAIWVCDGCAECGAVFECGASLGIFPETRRCPAHRVPGRKVKRMRNRVR